MTFQAYIDTIRARTGKTPEELRNAAVAAGIYSRDMKASTLVVFLKENFDLGHGHAMAIWKYFKDHDWVD